MLTPHFELSQDADFVYVRIRLPHLRTDDGEFYIEGNIFKFYLKPYFLRLTFGEQLLEDGRERAEYDAAAEILTVWLPKAEPGKSFSDLNMLTELLRKQPAGGKSTASGQQAASSAQPLIEVLSSTNEEDIAPEHDGDARGDAGSDMELDMPPELDIEAEQEFPTPLSPSQRRAYGFNDSYSAVFVGLEEAELLQIPQPEVLQPAERTAARLAAEDAAFSSDHYMADYMEDDEVRAALSYVPWWAALADAPSEEGSTEFTVGPEVNTRAWPENGSEEQHFLLQLPRKEFLLSGRMQRRALCGLVDLLYAYCYDVRTTLGEHTVESGWTLRHISTQLSWLDPPESVKAALRSCVRRALCYPLLRHWRLSLALIDDVTRILERGKTAVLKALVACRFTLLRSGEFGYLLNRVWVDDYCIWLQQQPERRLDRLISALKIGHPEKTEIGWPLAAYEALASEIAQEEHE
mmetsp:Transcript_23702/g.49637  ORF Transcript_23702/g.49637 Transcript_23702/m.49637 type:complete len:464 (+) Transcript_23702:282-1673(+)